MRLRSRKQTYQKSRFEVPYARNAGLHSARQHLLLRLKKKSENMGSRSGVRVMGTYRAFCFDGWGNVWIEDEIEARTAQEAIEAASTILAAVKVEVHHDDARMLRWGGLPSNDDEPDTK